MAVWNRPTIAVRGADSESATFSQRRFGSPTELVERTFYVSGGVPSRILQNNPRRLAWRIVNPDTTHCQVWHSASFLSYVGISGRYRPYAYIAPIIFPEGGVAYADVETDGEEVIQELWIDCPSGSSATVVVQEVQSA